MTFTEKLSLLTAKVNKSALCKSVNLPQTIISTYIAKGSIPRADIAIKFARALAVSPAWLFDDSQGMPPVPWSDPCAKPITTEDHARALIHHAANTLQGSQLFWALGRISEVIQPTEKSGGI